MGNQLSALKRQFVFLDYLRQWLLGQLSGTTSWRDGPQSMESSHKLLQSWIAPILLGLLCFVVYNANLRQIGAGDTVAARYLPLILWKCGTFDFDANARLIAQGHPTFTKRNRPAGATGHCSSSGCG